MSDGVTLLTPQPDQSRPSRRTAQGEWRGRDTGLGRIIGALDSNDVHGIRDQAPLGYADVLAARSGHVGFDLHWAGAPTAADLVQVVGHVQVSLDKGQLIGHPTGCRAGARPDQHRRTAAAPVPLDFSDLTDKGFAFDTVRGDFDLRGGERLHR